MHKRELAQRACQAIATLVLLVLLVFSTFTTTKWQGLYVELF